MKHQNKNKAWTDKDRLFIKDNYTLMSNLQLSEKLERTEDSVRKEFNKLELKRPKKADMPKIYRKRGRRKKILTVQESIQKGIEERKKLEKVKAKDKKRRLDESRRIANEALWASDFIGSIEKNEIPKRKELINPVVIQVPEVRATFNIDSNYPDSKIKSKIAAISKKYGSESVIIKNFDR